VSDIIYSVEKISELEPTLYEEDSFYFLIEAQMSDWYVYDSDQIGLITAKTLADKFAAFHGKIYFPSYIQEQHRVEDYWSATPLGVFRYKLLADGSYYLVKTVKPRSGYIVEGAYWVNGFIYLVRDDKEIFQIKLFMDHHTKQIQLYPDIQSL
jgi:hypothetical protein